MPKHLIADRSSIRTPTETVAALIALAAHRKQLTRWITTKQEVMDLLENYPNMRKRVRSSAFNTGLLIAMNEYDIAMFEIDRFTWGFVKHQRTKTWRRVGFAGLTDADLTRPNVIALEAEFGYHEGADAVDDEDDAPNLAIPDLGNDRPKRPKARTTQAIMRKRAFNDALIRFTSLARAGKQLDAMATLVASSSYETARMSENHVNMLELVRQAEGILLAPRPLGEPHDARALMVDFALLEMHFDTTGLLRDAEGQECEVTRRHIAERKWDMFLPVELVKILEGLKARLRERYNVEEAA